MNSDGTQPRVVTPRDSNPWAPAWSPDGKHIAYLECCADERAADGSPLLEVVILDENGTETPTGLLVETDQNGPAWVSNDTLLVNRAT
jgi:Tol biopolymer transport system component